MQNFYILTESNVTRSSPNFHNEGHIRMWYDSPLREFNPHIVLIVFAAILFAFVAYYIFFKVKKIEVLDHGTVVTRNEKQLQDLLEKRSIILDKMVDLEQLHQLREMNQYEFTKKYESYKQQLIQVKMKLKKFTE
ncbi:hypothetical protein [Chengkuizengella sediminis]|uniref:hypothetical protein n=1 Tax=Chengkuizengella sediminis TaxID=1885917 RepID=UPI001389CDB9|nr:hypothetical protein [Chengkuizengella sediminis]NDI33824.1 hypothetical protein [Chengkuizengella sediminis]